MTAVVLQGVGGILGSMIGGPIGGSIGALAGSLIGNLIDPPKIQGPRLGDTKLQRSTYGAMIPYAWGHGRIGTIVIDQTDLVEHKHKSGGKGGPEITTYTYTASWCSALCARLPNRDQAIIGITHLFADSRLIWTAESGEDCPCTVYAGSETQEPDPTFEAIHGAGNVPAYRGLAYLVFTDFDLTDYGNRIPQIEAVIYTKAGSIPWRLSSFDPWPDAAHSVVAQAIYDSGTIQTLTAESSNGFNYWFRKFNVQGVDQGGNTTAFFADYRILRGVGNLLSQSVVDYHSGIDYYWTIWNSGLGAIELGVSNPLAETAGSKTNGNPNIYQNGAVYTVAGVSGGVQTIGKYDAPGGIPTGTFVTSFALDEAYNESTVRIAASNDGHIYVGVNDTTAPTGVKLWKLDEDLNLVHFWDVTDTAGTRLDFSSAGPFHVYQSGVLGVTMVVHEFTTGGLWYVGLVEIKADNALANYGGTLQHTRGGMINLRGGLMLDQDGVFSLDPPAESETLADVCSDITSLTPTTSTVDVSELDDDVVRWFVIGSEMTARNALEKLRPPYFFDVVEEDYGIHFRKRGDREVVEIPDEDLVPFDGTGDLLRTVRKREQELPRTVTMTYIDVTMDWQTGAQSSPRQVTQSQYDVTLEIPVGFTAEEAAQKCWTIQCAEWNERESFQWQTTRRWAKVTPTTLAKVRGRIIRVQTVTESPDGKIAYDGVLAAPSIYTQTATGASTSGSAAQDPAAAKVGTELVLLDIPVISQHDAPFGFYAAMGPAGDGSWPGATLFKSLDGGVTYEAVASTSAAAVIGRTADVATSPSYSGALSAYGGGDVVEEAEIVVVLSDSDAELESCTSTALANGANLCAVSRGMSGGSPNVVQWEILQFRDATLLDTDPPTYVLGGFLRGRKGTLTSGHAAGDTFVLLPVTNVDAPEQELNVSLKYKAVTYGRAITTATAVDFINTGESTESFYDTEAGNLPVHVNEQTGTTYTVTVGDRFRLITFNNASPVAVTLPDGMPDGWICFIENVGGGDVTLTPTSWVIDDAAPDLTLTTDQGILLSSDGAQWWTMRGMGSAGGSPAGGGGSAIVVKDEGSTLDSGVTSFDFVGGGITATNVGHAVTVTVPLKAPLGASYVTLGTDADLTSERVLTGSSGRVTVTDGGAGSTVTLDLGTSGVTSGTYGDTDNISQITVDNYGRVTGAKNVSVVGRIITEEDSVTVDLDAIVLNFVSPLTAIDAGGGVTEVGFDATALPVPGTNSQVFTSSGTFTPGTNVELVFLVMVGGGGGGSARNAAASGGGGGGAGELIQGLAVPVTPSSGVTVTIGAGGNGAASGTGANTVGSNGGDTSFGSVYIAKGGKGGASAGTGGAGGGSRGGAGGAVGNPGAAGSVGAAETSTGFGGGGGGGGGSATNANGGAGAGSQGYPTGGAAGTTASTQAGGGSGASTPWGLGGAGGNGGADGSNAPSTSYGAGGGGGGGQAATTRAGGRGCDGYVLVYWFG